MVEGDPRSSSLRPGALQEKGGGAGRKTHKHTQHTTEKKTNVSELAWGRRRVQSAALGSGSSLASSPGFPSAAQTLVSFKRKTTTQQHPPKTHTSQQPAPRGDRKPAGHPRPRPQIQAWRLQFPQIYYYYYSANPNFQPNPQGLGAIELSLGKVGEVESFKAGDGCIANFCNFTFRGGKNVRIPLEGWLVF